MAKENTSPEEKLLALIRGADRKDDFRDTGAVSKKKDPDGPDPASGTQAPDKPDYASEIFKTYLAKNRMFDPYILKNINRYLIIVLAVLLVYFLFDLFLARPFRDVQQAMSKIPASNVSGIGERKDVSIRLKDYSYYSNQISGKSIFAGAEDRASGEKVDIAGDIAANIGLVGIIPGNNPQAIIEDKKNQKTYYLTKGQSFDGFTLDEIGEGKVVLEYGGRKIALFL